MNELSTLAYSKKISSPKFQSPKWIKFEEYFQHIQYPVAYLELVLGGCLQLNFLFSKNYSQKTHNQQIICIFFCDL